MVSPGETRELLGVQAGDKFKSSVTVNIEILRGFGLLVGILMLFLGTALTKLFVRLNPEDDKFIEEDTYIYKMFGFTHTCVWIDFNPSKTISAMIVVFVTLPLMIFTVLNRARIQNDHINKKVSTWIYNFSEWTWHIRFAGFAYFFMVFVNSPDGVYRNDFLTIGERFADEGWQKYALHYVPFFFWQLALALMSIEQTWYHYCLNDAPFGISKRSLKIYNIITALVLLYYTIWILSHMFGYGLLGKDNALFAKVIMIGYLVLVTLIPAVLALSRVYGVTKMKTYVIDFYAKEDTADEEN